MQTIIPRTRNVQRVGLARELVRVVTVDLYANVSCEDTPLHVAHGVTFDSGEWRWWFVSHDDAQRFGWINPCQRCIDHDPRDRRDHGHVTERTEP